MAVDAHRVNDSQGKGPLLAGLFRGQIWKYQGGCSSGHNRVGCAFDLGALSVYGDVVNAVANFFFVTAGLGPRREAEEGEQGEGGAL